MCPKNHSYSYYSVTLLSYLFLSLQVSYVTDISVSLSALVLTYPKSSEVLLRRNSFETSLAAFYQQVLVALVRLIARQDAAKEGGFLPPEVKEELLSKLQLARRSCVSLLRQMVQVGQC